MTTTFGKRGLPPEPSRVLQPAWAEPATPPARLLEAAPASPGLPPELMTTSPESHILSHLPVLTAGIVALLVLVYGIEVQLAGGHGAPTTTALTRLGAASFSLVVGSWQWWRLALAPVLHASTSHLVGNCVALGLVGWRLEPMIGRGWFGAIFAAGAVGGLAGSLGFNPADTVTVGASGAITALLAAVLVLSLHSNATAQEARRMQRLALQFGAPALLPLAFGAQDGTDYHAHLGGAIVGAALAFALSELWRPGAFRPDCGELMGRVAAGALPVVALSAGLAVFHAARTPVEAMPAAMAGLIPDEEMPADADQRMDRSAALAARYPADPRAHFFLMGALLKHTDLSGAEREARAVLARVPPEPDAPMADLRRRTAGVLAVVVGLEGRRAEARDLAREGCTDRSDPKTTQMLAKAGLCS